MASLVNGNMDQHLGFLGGLILTPQPFDGQIEVRGGCLGSYQCLSGFGARTWTRTRWDVTLSRGVKQFETERTLHIEFHPKGR